MSDCHPVAIPQCLGSISKAEGFPLDGKVGAGVLPRLCISVYFLNLENSSQAWKTSRKLSTFISGYAGSGPPSVLPFRMSICSSVLFFLVLQAFGLLYCRCFLLIVAEKTQQKHTLEKEVYDSFLSVAVDRHLFHLLQHEDSCTDVFYSEDSKSW